MRGWVLLCVVLSALSTSARASGGAVLPFVSAGFEQPDVKPIGEPLPPPDPLDAPDGPRDAPDAMRSDAPHAPVAGEVQVSVPQLVFGALAAGGGALLGALAGGALSALVVAVGIGAYVALTPTIFAPLALFAFTFLAGSIFAVSPVTAGWAAGAGLLLLVLENNPADWQGLGCLTSGFTRVVLSVFGLIFGGSIAGSINDCTSCVALLADPQSALASFPRAMVTAAFFSAMGGAALGGLSGLALAGVFAVPASTPILLTGSFNPTSPAVWGLIAVTLGIPVGAAAAGGALFGSAGAVLGGVIENMSAGE